jgi:hypothetical protein
VTVKVRLTGQGLQTALSMLQGREDRAEQLRPAFEAVAVDFRNLEKRRFSGQAGWAPLSPEYAKRKAAGGRPARPLAGGALERSLTVQRSRFSVRRINRASMFVGTRNPVANLHNSGTKRMPKRPLVAVRSSDTARWARIFADHLAVARSSRLGL